MSKCSEELELHSRIHPLREWGDRCYVKRDDELSFGISGSKVRKLRALVHNWHRRSESYRGMIALGGAHSNHLVSLAQVCHEQAIDLRILALGPARTLTGNACFLRLLVESDHMRWVSRELWSQARDLAAEWQHSLGGSWLILPEGGAHPWAMAGGYSLVEEVMDWQERHSIIFDRMILDSGSGFFAQSVLLAAQHYRCPWRFSVVLIAGDQDDFRSDLDDQGYQGRLNRSDHFELVPPVYGGSFGSTPRQGFVEIKRMARQEGILCDPVYSAKLFSTARRLQEQRPTERTLIVHSGGGLALTGFMDRLAKECETSS